MLSTAAFNALLKTLEEPPEHVVFVLCTTDPHKVPETIQSRCQRFDFRRLSVEEIKGYLERICKGEGYEFEPEALEFIAVKSAGGMRDATTSLEQVGVYSGGKITLDEATRMFGQIDTSALFDIAGHIARRDAASSFMWINDLVGKGVDLAQFARDFAAHLRNLYVTAITGGGDGIVACTTAQLQRYQQQAQEFGGIDRLARALDISGALIAELRNSADARLSVEIAMTRLVRPDSELTLEALAERVEALERNGVPQPVSMPAQVVVPQPDFEPAAQPVSQPEPSPVAASVSQSSSLPADVSVPQPEPTPQFDERPAPTSASAASTSELTGERLLAALLAVVRREDASIGALLSGVSLAEEDGQYHLLFPTGSEFQMRVVGGTDAKALIGKAFVEVLGHEAQFDCRIGSFTGLSASGAYTAPVTAYEDAPIDDGYYDELASREAPLPAGDDTAANIANALSAFGAGVKVQEINDEQ